MDGSSKELLFPLYVMGANMCLFCDECKSMIEKWLMLLEKKNCYNVLSIKPTELSKCIKCGSTNIAVEYHKGRVIGYFNYNNPCSEEEHLHFTCRTCQYDWMDETEDNKLIGKLTGEKGK